MVKKPSSWAFGKDIALSREKKTLYLYMICVIFQKLKKMSFKRYEK